MSILPCVSPTTCSTQHNCKIEASCAFEEYIQFTLALGLWKDLLDDASNAQLTLLFLVTSSTTLYKATSR